MIELKGLGDQQFFDLLKIQLGWPLREPLTTPISVNGLADAQSASA
jgi:hypothetical protein